MENTEWDVFISYAWEDKEFVRRLAAALRKRGLHVWYDEFALSVGDSLRESIDRGLATSRFGIVVLSPNFFARKKKWTQNELNALIAKERADKKVVLPIWHNITAEELEQYSPILTDRIAVSSDRGLDCVVTELLRAIERSSYNDSKVLSQPTATEGSDHPLNENSKFFRRLSAYRFQILLVFVLITFLCVIVWTRNILNSDSPTSQATQIAQSTSIAAATLGSILFSTTQPTQGSQGTSAGIPTPSRTQMLFPTTTLTLDPTRSSTTLLPASTPTFSAIPSEVPTRTTTWTPSLTPRPPATFTPTSFSSKSEFQLLQLKTPLGVIHDDGAYMTINSNKRILISTGNLDPRYNNNKRQVRVKVAVRQGNYQQGQIFDPSGASLNLPIFSTLDGESIGGLNLEKLHKSFVWDFGMPGQYIGNNRDCSTATEMLTVPLAPSAKS